MKWQMPRPRKCLFCRMGLSYIRVRLREEIKGAMLICYFLLSLFIGCCVSSCLEADLALQREPSLFPHSHNTCQRKSRGGEPRITQLPRVPNRSVHMPLQGSGGFCFNSSLSSVPGLCVTHSHCSVQRRKALYQHACCSVDLNTSIDFFYTFVFGALMCPQVPGSQLFFGDSLLSLSPDQSKAV